MKLGIAGLLVMFFSACGSSNSPAPTPAPGVAAQATAPAANSETDHCDPRNLRILDLGKGLDQLDYRYSSKDGITKNHNGELLSDVVNEAAKAICDQDDSEKAQALPKIKAIQKFMEPIKDGDDIGLELQILENELSQQN
jgi:hypothetical protein